MLGLGGVSSSGLGGAIVEPVVICTTVVAKVVVLSALLLLGIHMSDMTEIHGRRWR